MALILNLKYLEGLEGKAERVIKVNFRDYVKTSKSVRGKDSIYFGEQFEWPVGRKLDGTDTITVKAYNFSKYLNNKCIGSLTISLQQLMTESSITFREHLIDANHSIIRTMVTFELHYYSPDSLIGNWRKEDFQYPVMELPKRKHRTEGDGDGEDEDGESQFTLSDTRSLLGQDMTREMMAFENDNDSIYSQDDGESMVSSSPRKKLGIPAALESTLHKTEDYQVSVTIIEARQLAGPNINPCIEVRVGEKVKRTETQMSTNSPYYNQYFCFDFRMSKAELLDQVIHIRALAMGNMMISRLLPGDLIGEFRMDVRAVYNAPDRMFSHKWAMLIDPKDILAGSKGYVKCDLSVIGKGEQVKHRLKSQTKKSKMNEDEDIEANLLLPQNVSAAKRQMAEIAVKIYRAEDLPKMNTDFMASIKQAITGDVKPLVDPYVQVSFAGHTGKTKSRKNTYTPDWSEEVVFTEMFPSLCNRIRISVFDWDTVYNECIATHFVELSQIMNDGENDPKKRGFLPTFGPSWVNLYGTPRNYSYENMIHPREELNRGLGEGVAYRGRLLMAIKTTIKSDSAGLTAGARVGHTQPISENPKWKFVAGKREDFFLVGVLYEASVIDQEIGKKGKPILFELSIGTHGNHLDGKFKEDDEDDDDDGPTKKPALLTHSVTQAIPPATNDGEYYHVPFKENKPCLYLRCKYEDHRPRMYLPNIIDKVREDFERGLEEVQELQSRERPTAHRRMRTILDRLQENLEAASSTIKNCRGTAGKTMLDKERQKLYRVNVEKMRVKAKNMKRDCTRDSISVRIREAKALVRFMREMTEEPQHALPDVFLWMIQDGKRIAFARIPARHIIHSTVDEERGKESGKIMSLFLRKPGRKGMGQSGWTLQAQIKMYAWLGMLKEIRHYRTGIPEGYDENCFATKKPPNEVVYTERSYFQLRAHMFMARNLIGSDETGLSDAFARIILNDHVVTTCVINETLSPKWDQVLIVENLTLYFNENTIKESPPVIVVEVFDEDSVVGVMGNQSQGKSEFLGRCFCKPMVTLWNEDYRFPRLDWWEIYRGQTNAGELLAVFELIQLKPEEDFRLPEGVPDAETIREGVQGSQFGLEDNDGLPEMYQETTTSSRPPNLLPVPYEIRPKLAPYRVEIMFWGVRELQRIQLMAVDRPKVTIEFGGEHVNSETIASAKMKPNFPNPIKHIDLRLPEDEHFWPPLMIQCEDCRQFGRHVLVGNHVIPTVVKYIWKSKAELKDDEGCSDTEAFAKQQVVQIHSVQDGSRGDLQSAVAKSDFLATGAKSFSMASKSLTAGGPGSNVGGNGSRIGSPMEVKGVTHRESVSSRMSKTDRVTGSPGGQVNRSTSRSSQMVPGVAFRNPGASPAPTGQEHGFRSPSQGRNGMISPPGSPMHGVSDTVPLVPTDKSPESPATNGPNGRPPPAPPIGAPLGGVHQLKKRPKVPKMELEEVDWWSRYYASVDDLEDQDDDDEEGSDFDVLNDIEVDIKSEGNKDDVIDIPEDEEEEGGKKKKKKKKKKKDKKKKKKKGGMPFRRTDPSKDFAKEKDDDLEFEDNIKEDNSWIERVKIYSTPLEEVKDYGGFEAFIKTYPLYKGKQEDDEEPSDNRIAGYFKGNFLIYRLEEEEFGKEISSKSLKLHCDLPSNDPVTMLVRVYVIRANDLHPTDPNGKSDPYLLVKLGSKTQNDKENYIPKQLNPVFGKCFEMEVKFPQESMLLLQVMDWDMVSGDDLIGETKIDLENRYYSKHRATTGIANNYDTTGYNKWRDQLTPSQILARLCKEWHLDPPNYEPMFNRVTVSGKEYFADSEIEDEGGETKQSNEPLALEVLKNWRDVTNSPLVPEHIETRPLFNPEKPGIEQGRLEMWCDMFPKELGTPAPAVDITPRVPKSYELRVIIWNTEDVILNDDGLLTGEKSSDIFVKGWMKGLGIDDQVTDVHYRSLSGEGNFNWRFIYQFDYLKAEDKIVYKTKESPFSIDEMEVKAPCRLNLQVWDADIVSADDFLGGLDFPLSKIPRGSKSSKSCGLHQLAKDGSVPSMSIFRNKRCRGWWPFVAESEDEPNELEVTGKLDAEMQLLTADEAEQNPAGLGRSEPNQLPPPNRPDTSFFSFMNPLKVIKYLVCGVYKWLLIKLLIIVLLMALLVLFIYNAPGYLAKKMLGA